MGIHNILIRVKSAQTRNLEMAEISGNRQTSGLKIRRKQEGVEELKFVVSKKAESQSISGRI